MLATWKGASLKAAGFVTLSIAWDDDGAVDVMRLAEPSRLGRLAGVELVETRLDSWTGLRDLGRVLWAWPHSCGEFWIRKLDVNPKAWSCFASLRG